MSSPQWAVIATRTGFEEHAEQHLRQAGFRVYLPRMCRELTGHRTPRGRGETVLRPMLSGYLFAELHHGQWINPGPNDRWRHWRTPWDRNRAFVSEAAIAVLREAEAEEGRKRAERLTPTAKPPLGSRITTEWHGQHIHGVVRELRGNDRLVIETLAGMSVELSADAIRS